MKNADRPRQRAPGKWGRRAAMAVLLVGLSGCASGPMRIKEDPLEPLNRRIDGFNEVVDSVFLKPVAIAYREFTPGPVRTGVDNFFGNLGDVWTLANSMLQLKPVAATQTMMRLTINTTLGMGGLIDLATDVGLERHHEDFGQTLGYWGVPPGPYLVLPIMGPSTVRDTAAMNADHGRSVVARRPHVPTRNSLLPLQAVETRARLLGASAILDQAALDKYSFTRDAYLQRRNNDVFDGNPPTDEAVEPSSSQPTGPQAH